MKSPLLEESLDFWTENFALEVLQHNEFEGTGALGDDDAWSQTVMSDTSKDFYIVLRYDYNTTYYRRGNDLRFIAMRRSAYLGPLDALNTDGDGREFLEGPNFWVQLVGDEEVGRLISRFGSDLEHTDAAKETIAQAGSRSRAHDSSPLVYLSLSVRNALQSAAAYRSAIGSSFFTDEQPGVAFSSESKSESQGRSVMMSLAPGCGPMLQLVELAQGVDLVPSDAGAGKLSLGLARSRSAGSVSDAITDKWIDPDGYEVSLIPVLAYPGPYTATATTTTTTTATAAATATATATATSPDLQSVPVIDWKWRAARQDRLRARARAAWPLGAFGPRMALLEPAGYSRALRAALKPTVSKMTMAPVERPVDVVPDAAGPAAEKKRGRGVVIETFVPWCTRCVSLKPSLELLAECLSECEGAGVSFLALDASDRRFSYLHSDDVCLQTMLGWSQRSGFPSFFFLSDQVDAQPQVFEGQPTLREVGEWVARLTLVGEDSMLRLEELFTRDDADRRIKDENNNDNVDDDDDDDDDDCCTL